MSVQVAKKKMTVYYVNSVITVILMIGFGYLPPVEPLTPLGMQLIGIFVGMVYGWTTVSQVWPSLFGLFLIGLTDYGTVTQVVAEGWGSTTVLIMVLVMVFAQAVTDAGVTNYLAIWIMNKRIFFGKPWLFTAVIVFAAFLMSAFVNTLVAIIVCWSILYDICATVGYQKGDKWPALVVMGITVAATVGMGAFPYKLIPLLVFGSYQSMGGTAINYAYFVIVYWGMMFIIITLFTLFNKYIFKIDASKLAAVNEKTFEGKVEPLDKYQKTMLITFFLMILTFFMCNMLPASWKITQILQKLNTCGIAGIFVGLAIIIHVDGKPLMKFQSFASKGILWEPVILTAAALPISSALTSSGTGFQQFLVQILSPIFAGKATVIFAILIVALALIVTNFANNGVTALIFMAVVVSLASQVGANPTAMVVLLVFTVHIAVMTPAACPMAGMMFGNSEWINQKFIFREGLVLLLISFLTICTYGYITANLLF